MKRLIRLTTFVTSIALLASCAQEQSSITGWAYNDSNNGGFEKLPYEEQETGPN